MAEATPAYPSSIGPAKHAPINSLLPNMAALLSLPNEVLINILIAAPSTRALLRLSGTNRRMRSIWLEHSHHIIVSAYKTEIPHIEKAIDLTLAEVQCGEVSIPHAKKDHIAAAESIRVPSPLGLCLPRVLRNAGLASSVCNAASSNDTLQKITWQTEDPRTEILRAYFLIRHTLLAFDHPELRPPVILAFATLSDKMHRANSWVAFFMLAAAPTKLRDAHGMFERNPDAWNGNDRDPDQDPSRLVDRWSGANAVIARARSNHMDGRTEPPSFDLEDSDSEE